MAVDVRPLVLVVEDGQQHVVLLRLALTQRGYAVVVARTLEGARAMLAARPVQALLVASTAEAAARTLEALGEARPRPAVALVDDAPTRALEAGFDAAFARPVDFAELADALRDRIVTKRRSGTRARIRSQKPKTGST